MTALHDAIGAYVATIENPHTAKSYLCALVLFEQIAPADLATIDETLLIPFNETMSGKSTATRALSMQAAISFFAFLVYTKQSAAVSLDRAKLIRRKLHGRKATRISNYPMAALQSLVDYAKELTQEGTRGCRGLENLRDSALILTLAETGLRKSEAASLKLRDVDLEQGQAVVIGKGDKQAVVYFGESSLQAVKEYIEARPNKSPDSPLFARHGKGGNPGKKQTGHLDPSSINNLVNRRAREVLGHGMSVHGLRHYFVTIVWQQTHDLVLAKELARHENVETTMRYTHVSNDQLRDAHTKIFNKGIKP